MQKSKIFIQAVTPVMGRLNEKFKSLGLRRDAYLNNVFREEAVSLAKELGGKCNSSKSREYLLTQLRTLPTTAVSILLDKDVIELIEASCSKTNTPRDCFVNRIFYFLAAEAKHLESRGISIASIMGYASDDLRVNALDNASLFLRDPFHELRCFMQDNESTLYEWRFTGKVEGLNCFLDDVNVHDSKEYMDFDSI